MYDLVVFGASGFTGKFVVETIVNTLKKGENFTYAVAGRSKGKLDAILKEISDATGEDLSNVPQIIADGSDQNSLVEMAKKAKVILNCAGPFRFTGRQVVDACVEAGTHCVDLSAEQDFLGKTQLEVHEAAVKKGIYIVGSVGFDSIPADLGVVHLLNNFDGDINSVEEFIWTDNKGKPTKINYGTWASIIHGIANRKFLAPIVEKLNALEPVPPKPKHKLCLRGPLHCNKIVKGWCVPFPGADRSVVLRSQSYLYRLYNQRPVQAHAYVKLSSLFSAITLLSAAVMIGILVYLPFGIGKRLLLNHPRLMSFGYVTHEGPTREEMDQLEFTVALYGKGWSEKLSDPTDQHKEKPDKAKLVKVSGTNPGYLATCICMLQSALTIIREPNKMPLSGGVYPPGAAFAKTTLIERLQKYGIKFEVEDAPIA